ncbi:MAG: hypothetical protein G01um101448_268 [Parcubacteria group bacterium Gr01-1014_48]|nr:MAG: hypothetical protein Greene041614_296 [Parcubacteria group bacterium Greene0416_14]TSC74217.1 MAG: hypothetical protein G01um101448_268 [Parcubacteria group bacterium Gr01-1014_48]TSD01721.1 MAG: hypothetical protein Greene101415_119 [Parcubacteria group bacterium Greene1014_15]TSD07791.1 MAG: hypothetical protein Greene07144_716 [Parcubacteria group bacterium Greene0714_4]
MAEPVDKKEQKLWEKVGDRLKYVPKEGEADLTKEQEKRVKRIFGKGVMATPKKDREEDMKVLLPKKADREDSE